MRLAVSIPQTFPEGPIDPQSIVRFAQRAEELGFDSLWVQESIIGRQRQLDSIELLTFAAACTSRIRLGAAVLLLPLRSPVPLAKTLVTLDQLSGGRLTVALGLGRTGPTDVAFGVEAGSRLSRFNEALRILKALWTEESVTLEGKYWQLHEVAMEPKPVQKPHPPIWFGVHHPNALRRTARFADGFIGAGGTSTEQFASEVVELRRLLAELGRDPAKFPFSKRVYIAVDDDRERAGRRLSERLGGYGGHESIAVWGSVSECVARLQEVVRAGADMVLLTPLFDEAEQLEIFASEIRPQL
ncbi:MAG: LLM class flavin-dependent oxidoreductase [Chloroflexi bacterium]|nr:LLM class flavin-dependent oxidoreductase [Chloroflexota bacterium]MBV9897885.1 LLM class flavin-dependent oxidoreductase [Chloroflexota bacterium]